MNADEQASMARDYRACFSTASGERVLKHLQSKCKSGSALYVPGRLDQTAYEAGRLSMVEGIVRMMAHAASSKTKEP